MLNLTQCVTTEGRCYLHDSGRYRIDTRRPDAKSGRYLYQFCDPSGDVMWLSCDASELPDSGWMRVHTDSLGREIDAE